MKQTARVLGFILGGGILISQAVKGISYLLASKLVPSFGWLLFSLTLGIIAIAVQILCWTMIMRDLGASISLRQAMTGYVLNFLPRYIPGSVWGYFSRAEWLKKHYSIDYSVSHLGSIIEILSGLFSSLISVLLFVPQGISQRERIITGTGLFLLLVLLWIFLKKTSVIPSLRKISNPFFGFSIRLNVWLFSTLLLTLNWLIYGFIVYGTVKSVADRQVTFSTLEWVQYSGLFSFSWLIGFLSWFFPAGLGPRDWLLAQGLFFLKSIPYGMAYLIAVLTRFLGILSEIVWVAFNTWMYRKG